MSDKNYIEYELLEFDLSKECWREYDFNGRVYRINSPMKLFLKKNGKTHRVVDSMGVVHCLPIPGEYGCVIRWENEDKDKPVNF